jgi:signal transduction histidine kinase/CheY-like chemotaxis protein
MLVIDDVRSDPRGVNREWMHRQHIISAVTAPLIVRDTVVGVLVVMTRRRHRFTARQLHLLTSFATHAALAIYHARLLTIAEHRRRTAEALADISRLISQSLDVAVVSQRIVDSVRSLFGAIASILYRWDSELNGLEAFAISGDWGADLDGVVFPGQTGVVGHALNKRRPFSTADLLGDQRVAVVLDEMQSGLASPPSRSLLAVPLIMHERIIGVLGIGRHFGEEFDPDDVAVAQAFADQAAIAIENARLFAEQAELLRSVDHRRARLEAVLEVNREVSTIQPLHSLLRRVAETCGRLLDTDSVGIRLIEGDELVIACALGGAKEVMATPRLKFGESLSGLAAVSGQTVLLKNPLTDPRLLRRHREAMQRLGYRAFLAVPITAAGRVVGVLSIQTRRAQGFSEEDVAIVTAFAGQVGVALQNIRLYDDVENALKRLTELQNQLLQSQKMEAVGRLAGGVAHDFNNLLTVITAQSELLLRSLDTGEAREGIERIGIAAQRAAELTAQLLAFSRKQRLEPRAVDVNTVANELAPMLRRIIGEHIDLRTILEPDPRQVLIDPTQLRQVLMNLILNARDAMPNGGHLTIETANIVLDAEYARHHADITPGPHVMIAVSDTGIGMDAETRTRLFEPFFTTKEPGRGTGLGLATVYGIVKQSGGHIWVYSEVGRGTTFKIYLPATAGQAAAAEPIADGLESLNGCETVLLVEDEEEVRRLVHRILAERGYRVLEAAHPGAALDIATGYAGKIDLLLTDVVMPRMSGPVLARLLTDERSDTAVLFMSGYTDNAVVHHDMIGADRAFIQKPFSPDDLARTVRRVLDTRDHSSQGPSAEPRRP